MYEYISGKVITKSPTYVTIEASGIGYGLAVSLQTAQQLKEGSDARLFTHFYVREDDQRLYGFMQQAERSMFRLLLSVNGVGANTAILILSALPVDHVSEAIATGDVEQFRRIKGIGPKTAQRIIVDLKDKVEKSSTGSGASIPQVVGNTASKEAFNALVHLGFKRPAAQKAVKMAVSTNQNATVEELVKEALRLLS